MKIFISKIIPEVGIKKLEAEGLEVILPSSNSISEDELDFNLKNCDALLAVSIKKIDAAFFEKYPNIKAVALYSVGFNNVDVSAANARKIPIGNTPDVLSKATSDTAFLLMQMVARKATYYIEKVKDGNWKSFDPLEELGQELYGKTLGVFGLGRIGFEMAKKCKSAFGMNIIYHNRNPKPDLEKDLNARYVSFDELVENADVLSIHANYTADNFELFGQEIFNKMKPTSIFINTARGGFQNENDLFHALQSGKIWGAGLDVTNPEPMDKENPLLQLSNVCVFPHIGSATIEARKGMAIIAAENLIAFSKGQKMPHCVNPQIF